MKTHNTKVIRYLKVILIVIISTTIYVYAGDSTGVKKSNKTKTSKTSSKPHPCCAKFKAGKELGLRDSTKAVKKQQ